MLEESINCQQHLKELLGLNDPRDKETTCLNMAIEIFGITQHEYLTSTMTSLLAGKKCAEIPHYAYYMMQHYQFRKVIAHNYIFEFAGGQSAAGYIVNFQNFADSHEAFNERRKAANETQKKALDEYQFAGGMFQAFFGLSCFTYQLAKLGLIPDYLKQYEQEGLPERIARNVYE